MRTDRITSRPWLAGLGAGIGLLLAGLWCAQTPPIPVQVATAQHGPLRVEVNTNGKIEPLPDAELRVHARLEARILEIPEPGTRVAAGDVIVKLDAGPVTAELAAAESEHLAATEALRVARDTYERVRRREATDRQLFEQGALTQQRHAESQASLEEARARRDNLEREVPLRAASLQLQIQELRAQRDAATVTAPFEGTVYRTSFKKGEIVRIGDPILWLADLSKLRVRTNVDQVDLGRVRPGQRIRITSNAYPKRSWSAVVSELVPHVVVVDNRSVSEGLALVQPPTGGLVPGMNVDVDIIVDEVSDALRVPATAVYSADGAPFVYRVARGRVQRTPVVLGRSSVTAVEILDGLEVDDVVVAVTTNGLSDGSRVDAENRDVAAR
jgi:RND family efflux transporter MFP subunit